MSTADTSKPCVNLEDPSIPNQMIVFPESSFFKEKRASALPMPAEIRAINEASGKAYATNFNRPPTVMIPSRGLAVKYGADVTILEALTRMKVREQLQGQVPIPEVFGWTKDGVQGFIYMSLIQGETLLERWSGMHENERRAVCEELRRIVKAWRTLTQDDQDCYIGSFGKQPLKEAFLKSNPELVGPFQGADAVQQFQDACEIEINSEVPVVFTRNDFVPPNILLSTGPDPTVAAIIDWGQAGWYPAYWEYCKARRVLVDFDDAVQEEWHTKYLAMILDPWDDDAYHHPWLWFVLSKGI